MKRGIEICPLVLVVLAAAGISMGFQEMRSVADIEDFYEKLQPLRLSSGTISFKQC